MDRAIVYDAMQPRTVDFLNAAKFYMLDAAYQNRGWIGDQLIANRGWQGGNSVVAGLACLPTTPASLQVTVGVGTIYTLATTDAVPYGDLGADSHLIVKQGTLNDPLTLTITPPSTAGFSQIYLIEAQLLESDAGIEVIQYFNASNPMSPLNGPGGSGAAQPSVRTLRCNVILKGGTPATTGTELAPSVDPGCVGLYTIDVPNGATAITGATIKQLDNAPFFPTLPGVPPGVQYNFWDFANDTGTTNALVAKILPPVTSLQAGLGVFIKVANTTTAACTFNLNGLGAVAIHRANGSSSQAGDLNAGQVAALLYDGTAWQIVNFVGYTASTTNNNTVNITIPYAQDIGGVNVLRGNFSPPITALQAGNIVTLRVANTNSGPTTMQCDQLAPQKVMLHGQPLDPRAVNVNEIIFLFYDGTNFQLVNPRWPYYSFDDGSPPSSDVYMAVGDQVNITFGNLTSVPFHIATVPGVYEIEFVATSNPQDINTDLQLTPNNNRYSNKFCEYVIQEDYYQAPTLPGVDQRPMTWGILSSTYDNLGSTPGFLNTDAFQFDLWFQSGPWQSLPIWNDIGPFMIKITCSTLTSAKMCRYTSGIRGGAAMGWDLWEDTTTPWTSLGTLGVGGGQNFNDTVSGMAIVRRLA